VYFEFVGCDLGVDFVEGLVDLGDGFEGEGVSLLLVGEGEGSGVAVRAKVQLDVGV
jgi:hypothetical protein